MCAETGTVPGMRWSPSCLRQDAGTEQSPGKAPATHRPLSIAARVSLQSQTRKDTSALVLLAKHISKEITHPA